MQSIRLKMPVTSPKTTSVGRPRQQAPGRIAPLTGRIALPGPNVLPTSQTKALGDEMYEINHSSNSARHPQHKILKTCVDKVRCVCAWATDLACMWS